MNSVAPPGTSTKLLLRERGQHKLYMMNHTEKHLKARKHDNLVGRIQLDLAAGEEKEVMAGANVQNEE